MTDDTINKIVPFVEQLVTLADAFLSKDNTYNHEDHLGFMLLLFLSKQLGHMRTTVRLCPARDTVVIARAMIEGVFHLIWAAEEPAQRPLMWRHYAVVADWKLLKKKERNGEKVALEKKQRIVENVKEFGDQFLKPRGRKLVEGNQRDNLQPNHYQNNFLCGANLRQIVGDLETKYPYLKDQYEGLYLNYSDWVHWGTSGLGQAMDRSNNKIKYSENCEGLSASAVSCGFQCLSKTLALANEHFGAGLEKELDVLVENFIAHLCSD